MEKPLIVKAPSPGHPLGRNYCGNCQAEIFERPPRICSACGCEVSGWNESHEANYAGQKIGYKEGRGLLPQWGFDGCGYDENSKALM